MLVLITFVVVIVLLSIVVVAFRMFSFERVVTTSQASDSQDDLEDNEDSPDGEEQDGDGESEDNGEPVDLFDYFGTDKDAAEEQKNASDIDDTSPMYSDKLTEFKKGRKYLLDCHKSLEAAKEDGHIFCAIYFDYDRFSYINSLKGAAIGDYVLSNTAQHLRRIFPDGALLSRLSCDHFTAVFPLVDLGLFEDYYEQLRRMCEKIRNDIASKSGLRICVGFATTDNDASYDINVLLTRANIARHCVKVTKAEKYETYDETMVASNFFGDTLMENYTECQYGDDFVLYFERLFDIVAEKVIGCDTLSRWSCEDSGSNPITLDNGSIPTNNDKVFYQACRSMSRWRKAAREVNFLFVSVPATTLFKADIDDFIGKCLTEFQIEPASIVVKVEVSAVRLDWSMCSKQFKKFRDIGIKICVAGMDVGYSNLEFLTGLPIDFIKLHKSFAHNIEKSPEQLEKCRRIIERSTAIGARVIFEGVENMEQVMALRTINAKLVQGRYAGKVASTDDLIRDLPEHIEQRMTSDQTVILDEVQMAKGEWKIF